MPPELKVAIFFNVLLTVILGAVVLSVGYAPAPFPPDLRESVEIKLVPVEPAPTQVAAYDAAMDNSHTKRIEIPAEYRTPDQGAKPWVILPDGSVRFTDRDR
jgi:hypothetical protein